MKAAKVALQDAEKMKNLLLEQHLLNTDYLPTTNAEFIFFPLIDNEYTDEVEVVEMDLQKKQKTITIDDLFREFLTEEEMKHAPRSQEIIGEILLLEIPDQLVGKEKQIAEAYLKTVKNIKTVVKKTAIHSGQFRTRRVEVLAGVDTKETTHLESGVRLFMNVEETYFSARLGHERLRIANLVKKGEDVLVMFSGSAPYPLVLAKHSEAKKIIGIELNPKAHGFAITNREKNKVSEERVQLINDDVRVAVPKLKQQFDRILMPLPKTSEEFLDTALPAAKKGAFIHLYAFLNQKEIVNEGQNIVNICEELGFELELINTVKCGQHAPYTFRVCYDLKVF